MSELPKALTPFFSATRVPDQSAWIVTCKTCGRVWPLKMSETDPAHVKLFMEHAAGCGKR
jgi:uncharacterized Zn finger protein